MFELLGNYIAVSCGTLCIGLLISIPISSDNCDTFIIREKRNLVEINTNSYLTILNGKSNFVFRNNEETISKTLADVKLVDLQENEAPHVEISTYDSSGNPWCFITFTKILYTVHVSKTQIAISYSGDKQ
jgi:hypothetical protein